MSTKSIRFYVVVVAIILFTSYETMIAQVTIGADKLPETFSVLQLEGKYSKDKHGGLRLPQLSSAQRDSLGLYLLTDSLQQLKAQGLMIYNTSRNCTEYWNGRKWQGDANCCPNVVAGKNGVYLARLYGDECWMVTNSKEGEHSGYGYGGGGSVLGGGTTTDAQPLGLNGYYYSWDQATAKTGDQFNACPDGWHLPNNAEFEALAPFVNADKDGIGKWWTTNEADAFAGGYYNGSWDRWGNGGYWWSASARDRVFLASEGGDMNGPANYPNRWMTVRCVKDRD